jgi:hypothetical protein
LNGFKPNVYLLANKQIAEQDSRIPKTAMWINRSTITKTVEIQIFFTCVPSAKSTCTYYIGHVWQSAVCLFEKSEYNLSASCLRSDYFVLHYFHFRYGARACSNLQCAVDKWLVSEFYFEVQEGKKCTLVGDGARAAAAVLIGRFDIKCAKSITQRLSHAENKQLLLFNISFSFDFRHPAARDR